MNIAESVTSLSLFGYQIFELLLIMEISQQYAIRSTCLLSVLQGKVQEAEFRARQSLAIGQARLGPDHIDVARSLNGWAEAYAAQVRSG